MNTLIQNALISVGDDYTTAVVHIQGDRMVEIVPNEQFQLSNCDFIAPEVKIDSLNKLLLPGFINAHTHSSQIWQRGLIPQLPLELWLAGVLDSAPASLEQQYLGALGTAVNTLLSGGTCVVDHAYLIANQELETVAALVRGYKEVGIRAIIAPLLQDLPFVAAFPGGRSLPHQPFPRSAQESLALMEAIVKQFHEPEAGIYIAVGPAGFQRCSDELLAGCADLGDRYNLCFHTHLLETKAQQLLAEERYGESAVKHLQKLGCLGPRSTLAHSIWLNDEDLNILAATQSTVVHNPISNFRLGSGISPVSKYVQAGVNVTFGCDGGASNEGQDLLEAIKLGTILHTVTDFDYRNWLTPRQSVEMASLGAAKGLNLSDQIGSLEVGKKADLVLYDLTNLSLLPRTDPIQLLVLGRPNRVIDRSWVNGKCLVQDGQVLTVDVNALRKEFCDRSPINRPNHQSLFQTIHTVEAHYRKVMQLPPSS